MSEWAETNLPCERCGSSDAVSVNDNGWATCFSGNHQGPKSWKVGEDLPAPVDKEGKKVEFINHEPEPLQKRALRQATLKAFGYGVGEIKGRTHQIANYYNAAGQLIGQKVRGRDKKFFAIGDVSSSLFGSKVIRGQGKRLVITEGEIDAMSVWQALGQSWDVVSVPTGSAGAAKALSKHLEMLLKYDEVCLAFDDDDPGREAVEACTALFPPGKTSVATFAGYKDPNELMVAESEKVLRERIWAAAPHKPEGVVDLSGLRDRILAPIEMGLRFPYEELSTSLLGYRPGEVITLTAGTGAGKSTIVTDWIGYNIEQGIPTGILSLEEPLDMVGKRILGRQMKIPFHKPEAEMSRVPTQEEIDAAWEATMAKGLVKALDRMGALDPDTLMNRMRHLILGEGVKVLFLDHISMILSGLDAGADERKTTDKLYTDMKTLAVDTDATIVAVSHLSRGEGKSTEEGGKINMRLLRGSHSIGQLSDTIIAFERNQQADKAEDRKKTQIRVLKGRYSGYTGPAGALTFDFDTWRLKEIPDERTETSDAVAAFDDDF